MLNQLELHLGNDATEINISNPNGAIDITWKYATQGQGGHLFFLLVDLRGILTQQSDGDLLGNEICELHLNFSNYHIALKYDKVDFDKFKKHEEIALKALITGNQYNPLR